MSADEYAYDDARAEHDRHRENGARQASVFAKYSTKGIGVIEFDEPVEFGLTFVEQPTVAIGAVCDMDSLRAVFDVDDDATPPIPLLSGFVTEWDIDERGFYIGCWVACSIYFPPPTVLADQMPEVDLHFTFTAVAMKDIPLSEQD